MRPNGRQHRRRKQLRAARHCDGRWCLGVAIRQNAPASCYCLLKNKRHPNRKFYVSQQSPRRGKQGGRAIGSRASKRPKGAMHRPVHTYRTQPDHRHRRTTQHGRSSSFQWRSKAPRIFIALDLDQARDEVRGPSAAHRHVVDLSIEDRDHLQQATVQCPGLRVMCVRLGIEAALSGQQYEVATPSPAPALPARACAPGTSKLLSNTAPSFL